MSKSVKISHHNKKIPHTLLVRSISQRLCVSEQTVSRVLATYHEVLTEQLLAGNAISVQNFATYHLRRRDYDETRRARFAIGGGAGTLPAYCYYPYAEMSQNLRKKISEAKEQIAQNIGEAPNPDPFP